MSATYEIGIGKKHRTGWRETGRLRVEGDVVVDGLLAVRRDAGSYRIDHIPTGYAFPGGFGDEAEARAFARWCAENCADLFAAYADDPSCSVEGFGPGVADAIRSWCHLGVLPDGVA